MSHVVFERAEVLVYTAGLTCHDASLVRDTAHAIRNDSLMLKVRAQEVRGARAIHGGSDGDSAGLMVLIASVILERPTCLLCLGAKVGADTLAVVRTMERMSETITITAATDERCRACGSVLGPVYSLPRV
jgi:hypothetical protein